MARKELVYLFGKNLKCEKGKYPLNSDGTKLEIQPKGGKGHFMPAIDNDSKLYIPTRKKWLLFGERIYKEAYFAMKWSKKVVNFKTPEVEGPDPDTVIEAARAEVIKNYGKGKLETPLYIPVSFIVIIGLLLWVARLVGGF